MLCAVMGVAKSSYYAWKRHTPSARDLRDIELTRIIIAIHQASYGTYGVPRVHAELRAEHGVRIAPKRVWRLMRAAGLQGVHRRRTGRSQAATKALAARKERVFDDLVERDFSADAPDRVWLADITQHPTGEGWLYLACVLDVCSRRIVGWSMAERADTELVVNAVQMAVTARDPRVGLVHHSDQGAQYTSLAFGRELQDLGLVGSMGRTGTAHDNAAMESFFASLQTELLDRHTWPTRDALRSAVFHFIEIFYNRRRRHSSLGQISPNEFEIMYARQEVAA
jgi:transposase InsO family protein